jgi:energy-coupling factor transporter ATP-binding protein EcfA2
MNAEIALESHDVWYTYPSRPSSVVLAGVSTAILKGEFVALIGQNGSGKTTLAKHFNALLRPQRGRVEVNGQDIAGRPTATLASTVGYCYQNPDHQIFAATVAAEIEFGPRNLGVPEAEIQARTRRLLDLVGLRDEAFSYPFSLGRGQRQKVAVASVLATEPQILIVDEPTTGLDSKGGHAMMEIMRQLNEAGNTVIIITHDMGIVAEYSRRAICMANGRIVADGSPSAVFKNRAALSESGLRPPQAARIAQARPDLFSSDVITAAAAVAELSQRSVGQAAS